MPTINQTLKLNTRTKKKKKDNKKALKKCPQKKGVCNKILLKTPKKPNSALRKVAQLKLLSTNKKVLAHIPGEGHNLNPFSVVLIRGGNVKDLPSVRFKVIRGVLDLKGIPTRCNGRSKYGTKNWNKIKTN